MNLKCVSSSVCRMNHSLTFTINLIDKFLIQHLHYKIKKYHSTKNTKQKKLKSPKTKKNRNFTFYQTFQLSKKNQLVINVMTQNKGFAQFKNILNFDKDRAVILVFMQQQNNKHIIRQLEKIELDNKFNLDDLQTVKSEWTSQKSYSRSQSQLFRNSS